MAVLYLSVTASLNMDSIFSGDGGMENRNKYVLVMSACVGNEFNINGLPDLICEGRYAAAGQNIFGKIKTGYWLADRTASFL